jgi:hypothetical protein
LAELYSRSATLVDLDVTSRMIFNHKLRQQFFNGEGRAFDLLEHLKSIECRTLLLTGEDDPVTRLKMPPISRSVFLPTCCILFASPMPAMACSAMTRNALCNSSVSSSLVNAELMSAGFARRQALIKDEAGSKGFRASRG